ALEALARTYQEFLTKDVSLQDVCYTASLRRTHHEDRLALVGSSKEELVEHLRAFEQGELRAGISIGSKGGVSKLAYVLCGQGPKWWAMGRELLEEPVFRAVIEECDRLLREYADWSLMKELTADVANSRLSRTEIAQPAIFALQLGLARLLGSWGIEP